jgi:isoquinoline 1-oxidoreductase subunit beta
MSLSASRFKHKIAEIGEIVAKEIDGVEDGFAALDPSAALLSQATRRTVLKAIAVSGVSLAIGATLPADGSAEAADESRLNAWVGIRADGKAVIVVSQTEMGQGISTTLPVVLADELGILLQDIVLRDASFDPAYRHPQYNWMFTGNSESIQAFYDLMRRMGAAAREMLVAAAAQRLKVKPEELSVDAGKIRHAPSGRSIGLGAVAAAAARLPVPEAPKLKAQSKLAFVGRPVPRFDLPAKTDGSAKFGIDVVVPGMLSAALKRSPWPGGKPAQYSAERIKAQPGVVAVVELPDGIAVVARTYWQARKALDSAKITWSAAKTEDLASSTIADDYRHRLEQGPFYVHLQKGDSDAGAGGRRMEAVYEIPFQAHATMEPMNCTASVTKDSCEIWVPTQGMELTHGLAMRETGLPPEQIKIHRTLAGGGFGRRLLADFVKQAIQISKTVGVPIKLVWSREEDMTHDAYRPAMLHRISAVLDGTGKPQAIGHRVVSPSHLLYVFPRPTFPDLNDWSSPIAPPPQYDSMAVEGLISALYDIPNQRIEQHYYDSKIAVSVWRTTGHGPNNFVLESFIDELAAAAARDPLELRRELLRGNDRALNVLDLAAQKAGWGQPLPPGHARGLAFANAFGGLIAQVAEIEIRGKDIKLKRIVSAVDPGRVLDPGIAESNIAGGIVWGISALRTHITFKNGSPEQSNFDSFDPLHLWETPQIEVHFIESGEKLGGMGEIGPVPTSAAVCNAIAAATGERIRSLPITAAGFNFV